MFIRRVFCAATAAWFDVNHFNVRVFAFVYVLDFFRVCVCADQKANTLSSHVTKIKINKGCHSLPKFNKKSSQR